METDEDFPEELRETVKKMEAGLQDLQQGFDPLLQKNRSDFYQGFPSFYLVSCANRFTLELFLVR